MSKMLGFCLTLGDAEAWRDFSTVATARLTVLERVSIAFAALRSLSDDQAQETAEAALGEPGAPVPALLGRLEEARSWASFAGRSDLKAYALAAYERLSPDDRAAFLSHIGGMTSP